jgi:hypothetical protein
MAQTSSRVRDLAHSSGYGVRTRAMACQWLLLIALAKSASRTRRSNEFQHEFTPRDSRRGFREYILDLGEAGPSITPPGAACPPARLPWGKWSSTIK